jgi:hypothetical protein
MKHAPADVHIGELVELIMAEYREMPGLCLTERQMQRLWGLDAETCALAIESLTSARMLRRTAKDAYVADDL